MENVDAMRGAVRWIGWLDVWWNIAGTVALIFIGCCIFGVVMASIAMKIGIARSDRKRERDKRESQCDPRHNALTFEVANPLPSFEFKFVGGFLIASDKVLRLTLADNIGLDSVTVVALGKEYPAQELVPHGGSVFTSNENKMSDRANEGGRP